eukprot:SAG31_NODE_22565_length_522_cov_14.032206_1_plen_157_part_00
MISIHVHIIISENAEYLPSRAINACQPPLAHHNDAQVHEASVAGDSADETIVGQHQHLVNYVVLRTVHMVDDNRSRVRFLGCFWYRRKRCCECFCDFSWFSCSDAATGHYLCSCLRIRRRRWSRCRRCPGALNQRKPLRSALDWTILASNLHRCMS